MFGLNGIALSSRLQTLFPGPLRAGLVADGSVTFAEMFNNELLNWDLFAHWLIALSLNRAAGPEHPGDHGAIQAGVSDLPRDRGTCPCC